MRLVERTCQAERARHLNAFMGEPHVITGDARAAMPALAAHSSGRTSELDVRRASVPRDAESEECTTQESVDVNMGDADRVLVAEAGDQGAAGDELYHLWRADWRVAAEARARGAWRLRVGKGNAPGTREALRRSHTLVMVCCAKGCAAFVDLQAARRAARKNGRSTFASGDGCASRVCSRNFRPGQFRRRQDKMAQDLLSCDRRLMRWPATITARAVWCADHEEVCRTVGDSRVSRGGVACP